MGKPKVVFLGAGAMAEAMISGIVRAGKIACNQLIVTNRSNQNRLDELKTKYGVSVIKREQLNLEEIDILILVMKPKDVEDALYFLKTRLMPHVLILSAVAGTTTSWLEKNLPIGQQVVRIMPNTSCLIGESATAICPGKWASEQAISKSRELVGMMGAVFLIDEDKMDIFTGIAGSGPAYFYYLMEYMEIAGKEEGLKCETVREISAQTLLGAAKMILQQKEDPSKLREKVMSPQGTTAAGIKALEKHGGGFAIFQAVKGAANRSKEMSSILREKFNR